MLNWTNSFTMFIQTYTRCPFDHVLSLFVAGTGSGNFLSTVCGLQESTREMITNNRRGMKKCIQNQPKMFMRRGCTLLRAGHDHLGTNGRIIAEGLPYILPFLWSVYIQYGDDKYYIMK